MRFSPTAQYPKPTMSCYVRPKRKNGRLKEVKGGRERQMRARETGREETRRGSGKLRETDQSEKKS